MRRCRLRFRRTPDPELRARIEAAVAAGSPPPVLRWEVDDLNVEYGFPECCFEDFWRVLRAAGIDGELRGLDRMRGRIRSLLEHNERELLRRPAGWGRHLDRAYLVCAADPAAAAARGGRLWRKHERKG
jgi:hypothetical protein